MNSIVTIPYCRAVLTICLWLPRQLAYMIAVHQSNGFCPLDSRLSNTTRNCLRPHQSGTHQIHGSVNKMGKQFVNENALRRHSIQLKYLNRCFVQTNCSSAPKITIKFTAINKNKMSMEN